MRYVHLDNDVYERYVGTRRDQHDLHDHQPGRRHLRPRPAGRDVRHRAGASTSTTGDITGTVPATLALTLGTAAPLGPFVPGVARDYTTTMTATATSTGADAALSVIDPSATATGRLVNGTYALTSPLQVSADGGAFAPLRTDNGPLALAAWNTPITNRNVQLGFKQSIGADRGPAHRQLRQDADLHAVDDAAVNRFGVRAGPRPSYVRGGARRWPLTARQNASRKDS